ncbi:MAG: redoxin domain-containing protein, partial [Thermomicrobiales bacterium]
GLIGLIVAVVSVAVLAVLGWLVLHLLQQNGRILGRLEHLEGLLMPGAEASQPAPGRMQAGLPVGSPAPAFSLSGLYGETLTLDALRAQGKPVMLLFSDPGCGPCTALLPEVGRWQRERSAKLTVAVISRGAVEANRAKVTEHGVTATLIQQDREVSEQYQAHGTPSAVIVSPDGTIGSSVAQGAEAIRRLINGLVAVRATIPVQPAPVANGRAGGNGHRAVAPQAQPQRHGAPQIGQDAPPIALPDLDGEMVDLSSFRGNRTLVLFWNPGCGFCQRMLGDLKAWEANSPTDAPRLLVVSTGAVEVNRAMGLRSTVVLDQGFNVGREFGASGTPSAALVDGDGKIASQLVVGAPDVLNLAGDQQASVTAD